MSNQETAIWRPSVQEIEAEIGRVRRKKRRRGVLKALVGLIVCLAALAVAAFMMADVAVQDQIMDEILKCMRYGESLYDKLIRVIGLS